MKDTVKEVWERNFKHLLAKGTDFTAKDFVKWNEISTFQWLIEENLIAFTEDHTKLKNWEEGKFLSQYYALDELKLEIDTNLSGEEKDLEFAIGSVWLPIYNAECWPLPFNKCAILINAFMLNYLEHFSKILIKTNGHLYFPLNESKSLNEITDKVNICTPMFVRAAKKLTESILPKFTLKQENTEREFSAWQLSRLLLKFAVGHELGHVLTGTIPEKKYAIPVSLIDQSKIAKPTWENEFNADLYSFSMLSREYGRGVLNFADCWFRVSEIYGLLFGLELSGETHPPILDRFVRLAKFAKTKDLIDDATEVLYTSNHAFWIVETCKRLRQNHAGDLNYLRNIFK